MGQGASDAMVKSADEEEAKRADVAKKKQDIQMREYEERERIKTEGLAKREGVAIQSSGDLQKGATPPVIRADSSKPTMTVTQIQNRLTQLGYHPGTADGKMGPMTVEALKKFQQDNNLPQTGRADNETVGRLQN